MICSYFPTVEAVFLKRFFHDKPKLHDKGDLFHPEAEQFHPTNTSWSVRSQKPTKMLHSRGGILAVLGMFMIISNLDLEYLEQ